MEDVRVRRAPALWRRAPGYLTVAAVDGASLRMGGSAGDVWELLPGADAEPRAVSTVVAELAAAFGAPGDVVERDVAEVLAALESLGCVVRVA